MRHDVLVHPPAAEDIEAAFLYLVAEASAETAVRWYGEMEAAIQTLTRMPERCPSAPESKFFEVEIRQLLVPPYRVLFTVRERFVHVLHVRHMARASLAEDE